MRYFEYIYHDIRLPYRASNQLIDPICSSPSKLLMTIIFMYFDVLNDNHIYVFNMPFPLTCYAANYTFYIFRILILFHHRKPNI